VTTKEPKELEPNDATILIAEDEAIVAMDIKTRLQRFGYRVTSVVSTGQDAICRAEELRPELILMDIMLHGDIDGITAAEWIGMNLQIPIIFLTAYSETTIVKRAKAVCPYGYLLKPFDEQQLRIGIEMALAKHRQDRERAEPHA
jgi:CheY-like chemotaxis protein